MSRRDSTGQPDLGESIAQLVGALLFGARSCCVRCRRPVLHTLDATGWKHECSDPTLGALLREARRETSGDLH